jgi:hypothetical protein
LTDGSGYILIFKSGKSIVIYNGKDGANGKDATIPTISVAKDTDGYYYWTIDGEWLMVDGMKVRASAKDGEDGKDGVDGKDGEDGEDGKDGVDGEDGEDGEDGKDGKDGEDGKDGITPQFKIENDFWYISYDNGKSWEELGKATGNDGLNGTDGDTMFKRVYVKDGYVYFELNDDANTIITIPFIKNGTLQVFLEKEGILSRVLTYEETRTTTSLVVKGRINTEDMRYIQLMNNLQKLDLSDAVFECTELGRFAVNPYQDTPINKTLLEIKLPKLNESKWVDIAYCLSLRKITINSDSPYIATLKSGYDYPTPVELCNNVKTIEYAEGVKQPASSSSNWNTAHSIDSIIYPSTLQYIPSSLTITLPQEKGKIGGYTTYIRKVPCKVLVCKANIPPVLAPNSFGSQVTYIKEYSGYASGTTLWKIDVSQDAVLYVPKESIELYKVAPLWDAFQNIKAIEEM